MVAGLQERSPTVVTSILQPTEEDGIQSDLCFDDIYDTSYCGRMRVET